MAFLSTALVPLAVMPQWARTLAQLNLVTVVVDGSREAMLGRLGSAQLGWSVAVLAALAELEHSGSDRAAELLLERGCELGNPGRVRR